MTDELRIKVIRILLESEQLTVDEVADIHKLMCLAVPVLVKEETYTRTRCPNCKESLSKSYIDGYYNCEHVESCPNCMQKLKWKCEE